MRQDYFHPAMKGGLILLCFLLMGTGMRAQLLPLLGNSRTATAGFQFLKIAPDARAASLGQSHLATVDDASALFWNPAGICGMDSQRWQIAGHSLDYFADIGMTSFALVHAVSRQTYLGISTLLLSTGPMPVTTEFQPFGTGQSFSAYNLATGLTLARVLTDQFRFGLTTKYVREDYADVHAATLTLDFGFQYEIGKARTRFAAGVSHFGFNTEPAGAIEQFSLSGVDTIDQFERIVVPSVFRIGMAWDPVMQPNHRLTLCGQLNHPTDNNETYGLGLEYRFRSMLIGRMGYLFGNDAGGLPNFGFGVQMRRPFGLLQLDYGFESRATLGSVHRVGATFGLY